MSMLYMIVGVGLILVAIAYKFGHKKGTANATISASALLDQAKTHAEALAAKVEASAKTHTDAMFKVAKVETAKVAAMIAPKPEPAAPAAPIAPALPPAEAAPAVPAAAQPPGAVGPTYPIQESSVNGTGTIPAAEVIKSRPAIFYINQVVHVFVMNLLPFSLLSGSQEEINAVISYLHNNGEEPQTSLNVHDWMTPTAGEPAIVTQLRAAAKPLVLAAIEARKSALSRAFYEKYFAKYFP